MFLTFRVAKLYVFPYGAASCVSCVNSVALKTNECNLKSKIVLPHEKSNETIINKCLCAWIYGQKSLIETSNEPRGNLRLTQQKRIQLDLHNPSWINSNVGHQITWLDLFSAYCQIRSRFLRSISDLWDLRRYPPDKNKFIKTRTKTLSAVSAEVEFF